MPPKSMKRRHGVTAAAKQHAANGPLEVARRRKKMAERRGPSEESISDLLECVQQFQAAIQICHPSDRYDNVFEMAESFQLLADYVASRLDHFGKREWPSRAKLVPASSDVLKSIRQEASNYYNLARDAYESIASCNGENELCQAAFVNAANCFVSIADISSEFEEPSTTIELLSQAKTRYEQALLTWPSDTEIMLNLADCCVQQAEAIMPAGSRGGVQWGAACELYQKAMSTYELACSLCDAKLGGDLASLLHNWSLGILSQALREPEPEDELALFSKAEDKLKSACSFRKSDADQRMALGEALCSHAERAVLLNLPSSEVVSLLVAAVEEAFRPVLQFDSLHVDARLGLADAELALGKVFARDGDGQKAAAHWSQSVEAFRMAIRLIESGRNETVDFEGECDALYNLACGYALLGMEEECRSTLQQLKGVGVLAPQDLAMDVDFHLLRGRDWFGLLLR